MTLTARETMQALLDGKTLSNDRCGMDIRYKLDDKGNLLQTYGCSYGILRSWTLSDLKIYEEYPLDFEQALRAMLDGKVVEVNVPDANLRLSYRFNRELSCFEFYATSAGKWETTYISKCEQSCKWKVVE